MLIRNVYNKSLHKPHPLVTTETNLVRFGISGSVTQPTPVILKCRNSERQVRFGSFINTRYKKEITYANIFIFFSGRRSIGWRQSLASDNP